MLRSRTERLRFLRTIHTALAMTALVAVLLATLLGYAVARTVTRPLDAITGVMRDMAATGDLTRKIAVRSGSWDDEDARLLATTFNTLIASIARFQREAAQRERLSALGRLSTVVAHEIRNPLMIIKASLRMLRQKGASANEIREAATDIAEEADRLNRVVNDVLDFARPIRFDVTPADLNAICSASAAAVQPGDVERRIQLALDPALPTIMTDAERLRIALVNILSNALQAVTHDGHGHPVESGAAGVPGIVVETMCRARDRVAVVVRDRGAGIDAEVLPHVFEPYFTTKRTGTGLGLAIAKNIVDGLGGSIVVRSQAAVGTEITIELPIIAVPAVSASAAQIA